MNTMDFCPHHFSSKRVEFKLHAVTPQSQRIASKAVRKAASRPAEQENASTGQLSAASGAIKVAERLQRCACPSQRRRIRSRYVAGQPNPDLTGKAPLIHSPVDGLSG